MSILYIILAILGIGFLIFVHELGHYFMAKRVGIRVEVFSIGFGKPFYSWTRNGVKWQLCFILLGGFVKMAGMEKKGSVEPSEIKDGYFGSKPFDRIKVAAAGPIVNLAFALIFFTIIFASGGRLKPFAEFTKFIGWVDPKSEIADKGISPGDEIIKYNGEKYSGYKDLIYGAISNGKDVNIQGFDINYYASTKKEFDYTITPYKDARFGDKNITTSGILLPANYLLYKPFSPSQENPIPEGSPMEGSGIEYGDRIVWADGELIFSTYQLGTLINQSKSLLTIERSGKQHLIRVPRVPISALQINRSMKGDLSDWQHDVGLKGSLEDLWFIPYEVSEKLVVEDSLTYLNKTSLEKKIDQSLDSSKSTKHLAKGDKILAIDGKRITSNSVFLEYLQEKHVPIIVQKAEDRKSNGLWSKEDAVFEKSVDWPQVEKIAQTVGTPKTITSTGKLQLLKLIKPIKVKDYPLAKEKKKRLLDNWAEQEKAAKEISDPVKREEALQMLNQYQNRLILGIALQDQTVRYNPNPFALFGDVFKEIYKTLIALVTGYVSPKHLAGPVGMLDMMQKSWSVGLNEALFWLGAVSLNLGILNLLPIPVLDGGHICLAIVEKIRGKAIKIKTMERLIIPFVILFIIFFIYLTYNDIARIFFRFFK